MIRSACPPPPPPVCALLCVAAANVFPDMPAPRAAPVQRLWHVHPVPEVLQGVVHAIPWEPCMVRSFLVPCYTAPMSPSHVRTRERFAFSSHLGTALLYLTQCLLAVRPNARFVGNTPASCS